MIFLRFLLLKWKKPKQNKTPLCFLSVCFLSVFYCSVFHFPLNCIAMGDGKWGRVNIRKASVERNKGEWFISLFICVSATPQRCHTLHITWLKTTSKPQTILLNTKEKPKGKKQMQYFIQSSQNTQTPESCTLTTMWLVEGTLHTGHELRTLAGWGFQGKERICVRKSPYRSVSSFTFKQLLLNSPLQVMWNQCLYLLWTFRQAILVLHWPLSPSEEQEPRARGVPRDLFSTGSIFHNQPSATSRVCVSISLPIWPHINS